MTVFISFLRAVNVAGHGAIRMTPLAELFREIGFDDVTTVLQSGNVVFTTGLRSTARVAKAIGEGVEARFGFRPEVMLRTGPELRQVLERNPWAERRDVRPNRLLVMFLARLPATPVETALAQIAAGPEEIRANGRELYLHYPDGIGRSKLTGSVIERALGVPGTARNLNTLNRLSATVDELEAGRGGR